MTQNNPKTSWKEIFFEKKYPLWVLLLITVVYAFLFYFAINV